MTRHNCPARKLVLLLALVSLVGAGVGHFADDLCASSIAYADDPGAPPVQGALAFPLAAQSLPHSPQRPDSAEADSPSPGGSAHAGSILAAFAHSAASGRPRRC